MTVLGGVVTAALIGQAFRPTTRPSVREPDVATMIGIELQVALNQALPIECNDRTRTCFDDSVSVGYLVDYRGYRYQAAVHGSLHDVDLDLGLVHRVDRMCCGTDDRATCRVSLAACEAERTDCREVRPWQ